MYRKSQIKSALKYCNILDVIYIIYMLFIYDILLILNTIYYFLILLATDVNIDQSGSYPAVASPIRSIMTRLALSVHSSSSPHGPERDRQIIIT